MKIKYLVQGIPDLVVKGSKEVEITGLTADSNTVAPHNLFIAKKGLRRDGTEFISQAIDAGAIAIVTSLYHPLLKHITQLLCEDPGKLEAKLAARYYHNPSKKLWVAGITGTKGKTTTSYLIRHLLDKLGLQAGLIGGVETIIGEKRFVSMLTTHDAIQNQKWLSEMYVSQCKAAVLEVSSHGLHQKRIEEIDFDLVLFTNLYPDHLDYHKSMDEYAAAKKRLFDLSQGTRVFNADSPWVDFMKGGGTGLTFGIKSSADITASEICLGEKGTSFVISYEGKKEKFFTSLIGYFNVYNLLGAISVGLYLNAPLSTLASIFLTPPQIPGRLEAVENELGLRVYIDFAHSGEALANVLITLRDIAKQRIIVVFGAGGNRDPQRRSGMAAAAAKWADFSIITSDNPRQENPMDICQQILNSFPNKEKTMVEVDRKKAIYLGIEMAKEGDIVLIAGKGHERTQTFGSQTIPFDDVLVAKEALQNRSHSAILS